METILPYGAAVARARHAPAPRASCSGRPGQTPGVKHPVIVRAAARDDEGEAPGRVNNVNQPRLMRQAAAEEAPWSIGTYVSKKRLRKWDAQGNFLDEQPEALYEPVGWTPDRQLQFAIR